MNSLYGNYTNYYIRNFSLKRKHRGTKHLLGLGGLSSIQGNDQSSPWDKSSRSCRDTRNRNVMIIVIKSYPQALVRVRKVSSSNIPSTFFPFVSHCASLTLWTSLFAFTTCTPSFYLFSYWELIEKFEKTATILYTLSGTTNSRDQKIIKR